jgi:hypothetical protein
MDQAERNRLLAQYKAQGMSNVEALRAVNSAPAVKTPAVTAPATAGQRPADLSDREWQMYQQRLQGVNPVTGGAVSQTQQNILNTQRAQQSGEMSMPQAQQARDDRVAKSIQSSTTINNYGATDPEQIKAQQAFNLKYGLPEGTGIYGEGGLAKQPVPQRNMDIEQELINKYGQPGNNEDMASYYEMAYGKDLGGLIASGQVDASVFSPEKLRELGIDEARLQYLVENGFLRPEFLENFKQLMDRGIQAESVLGATPKPTNEMMGILSEALNAKSNFKDQPLGVSDLFTAAGLSGYEVLAQSLGQRAQEMRDKSMSAANIISSTGGAMAETYKAIADNYNQIQQSYEKQMDRLLAIDAKARDYEFAFEKMAMQHQLNMEMEGFKYGLKEKERAAEAAMWKDTMGGVPNIGGINIKDEKTKGILGKIFGIGSIGDWCGVFASKISDAGSVGNSWAEKRQRITHQNNPTIGDKLLIPIGVKTDKGNARGEYGHVAVVLGYDRETNTVTVVESNRDGRQNLNENNKGIISVGTYNLDEIRKEYIDDWGFMKGNLRKEYYNPLIESLPPQLAGAVQLASGDALGGVTNMAKGFATGFTDAVSSLGKSEPKTKSFKERYEEATGKLIDSTAAAKLKKEFEQGTIENYLRNLEAVAAEKNMSEEDKEARDLVEGAKEALTGGKTPDDIFKEIKQNNGKEMAERIMDELGYKWSSGGQWVGSKGVYTPDGWVKK